MLLVDGTKPGAIMVQSKVSDTILDLLLDDRDISVVLPVVHNIECFEPGSGGFQGRLLTINVPVAKNAGE